VTDIIIGVDNSGALGGGAGNDDTHGCVVMPDYDITDKLQFVAKWAYMADHDDISNPQDNAGGPDDPAVDDLHTFYVGINYRICGDKLKLMAGYEYATGDVQLTGANYESDAWLLGVRTYW
jgi:phosphate-selective porin OprO/OprP